MVDCKGSNDDVSTETAPFVAPKDRECMVVATHDNALQLTPSGSNDQQSSTEAGRGEMAPSQATINS